MAVFILGCQRGGGQAGEGYATRKPMCSMHLMLSPGKYMPSRTFCAPPPPPHRPFAPRGAEAVVVCSIDLLGYRPATSHHCLTTAVPRCTKLMSLPPTTPLPLRPPPPQVPTPHDMVRICVSYWMNGFAGLLHSRHARTDTRSCSRPHGLPPFKSWLRSSCATQSRLP